MNEAEEIRGLRDWLADRVQAFGRWDVTDLGLDLSGPVPIGEFVCEAPNGKRYEIKLRKL